MSLADEPAATLTRRRRARRAASGGRDRWARAADACWRLATRVHLGTRRPSNWVQLFKFGVVGGSGYLLNLAVFALLFALVGVGHIPAAVGAFAVAVTNNFVWNRHWTFRAGAGHRGHQGARFLAVSLAGLGVNLAVLELLVGAGLGGLAAQALAVAVALPVNFLGNKLWTFELRPPAPSG